MISGNAMPAARAKDTFDLTLKGVKDRIQTMRILRDLKKCGLLEARNIVDAPKPINMFEDLNLAEAQNYAGKFAPFAEVEIDGLIEYNNERAERHQYADTHVPEPFNQEDLEYLKNQAEALQGMFCEHASVGDINEDDLQKVLVKFLLKFRQDNQLIARA